MKFARPLMLGLLAALLAVPAPALAQWRLFRARGAQTCTDRNNNGICDSDEVAVTETVVTYEAKSPRYSTGTTVYRSGGSAGQSYGSHGGYAHDGPMTEAERAQADAFFARNAPRYGYGKTAEVTATASCPCGEGCQCCADLQAENARLKAKLAKYEADTFPGFSFHRQPARRDDFPAFAFHRPSQPAYTVAMKF